VNLEGGLLYWGPRGRAPLLGTQREGSFTGDPEGGLLYCGPGGRAPLLWTSKGVLKRYIKRYVKMPCKWVSLSIGALLGNLEGILLPGLSERNG
jgi:hypothetical protein